MINKQESKYWESLLSSQMHIILVITSNMLWNPTKCQILESKSSSFMIIIIIIIEILQLSACFFFPVLMKKINSIFSGTMWRSFSNKLQTVLAGGKAGLTVQTILLGLRRGGAKGQRVNSTCSLLHIFVGRINARMVSSLSTTRLACC